ncbi:MAG TPA: response regulator [Chloroflexota bacterium]|nr:response regulator [Chloroflexota bacterium]
MAPRAVLIAAPARDPFTSELVQRLQEEGREVLVTHDTDSTLRLARSERPALVVLDTVLPDGDGLALCRRLKGDPSTRDIPVFVFSVLMARDQCLEAGADGFMLKPVEQEMLLNHIQEILNNRVCRLPSRAD